MRTAVTRCRDDVTCFDFQSNKYCEIRIRSNYQRISKSIYEYQNLLYNTSVKEEKS